MALLIGCGLGLALLYAWLLGNWFARLIAFPLIAFALAGSARALLDLQQDSAAAYLSLIVCTVAAWFAADTPRRLRRRVRVDQRVETARRLAEMPPG
jgi:hypothetical protein